MLLKFINPCLFNVLVFINDFYETNSLKIIFIIKCVKLKEF